MPKRVRPPRKSAVVSKRPVRRRPPYWAVAPGLTFTLVLIVVPLAIGLFISFSDVTGATVATWTSAPFLGLSNYGDALSGEGALGTSVVRSLLISIAFALTTTIIITPLGILSALLAAAPTRFSGVIRVCFILPYAIPPFVNGVIWRLLFLNDGLINRISAAVGLGGKHVYWLLGERSFWAIVIADAWASWPFIFLFVLAGLQGIPAETLESAYIDGASRLRATWSIKLPMLRRVLALALLLSTINHFNNFTLPYVMLGAPAPSGGNVIPLHIYSTTFTTFQFGVGAAMGVISVCLVAIPAIAYVRAVRLSIPRGVA